MVSSNDILALLPLTLQEKYNQGGAICTAAIKVAEKYDEWFQVSGIPFFRNYTDHSFVHCLEVFKTSIDFIPEESFSVISSSDIAILLMSCCCHDAGMHLTELQFLKLIKIDEPPLSDLDAETWAECWTRFYQEARRFNDKLLVNLFGDTKPVGDFPTSELDFTNRDKLLVGEFLRRNHPRLAHELALGIGEKLDLTDLMPGLSDTQKDIVGLVARSHGGPLRSFLDQITRSYDVRDFQGIHIVYLMSLLRISDYAQIQATRAPLIHTKIHKVSSPISAREWRVHQSVRNINNTHEDPESIYVDSRPENVVDFSRVKFWLTDLQSELDTVWAVLGEVYGRHTSPALDSLKIKIRRVRSNVIDDGAGFPFVPEVLKFKVAEAEMLSLLLGPLYGNHPMYGMREMIQNARDATLERGVIQPFALRPEIDIRIDQSCTPPTVEIVDSGIGMSLDVIKNYFLNAGASYRASDEWRTTYADQSGHSKINRSGRFGVGALAAFLIGDRIEVATRLASSASSVGFGFSCSLQDEAIEIREIETDVGTSIKVASDEKRVNQILDLLPIIEMILSFDDISINIEITKADGSSATIPVKAIDEEEWDQIKFSTPNFDNVSVRFMKKGHLYGGHRGKCYVNGIAIGRFSEDEFSFGESVYPALGINVPIKLPGYSYGASVEILFDSIVLVEDKDALVKLNLSRTDVTQPDSDLSTHVSDYIFEKYKSELSNYHENSVAKNQWLHQKGWFYLNPSQMFVARGHFAPNDIQIFKRMDLRYVGRLSAPPTEIVNISSSMPDTAFLSRYGEMSAPDAMNFFRDLRYEAGYTESSSAIFVGPKTWLASLLDQKSISNWVKNDIRNAEPIAHCGKEKLILRFGRSDDDLNQRLDDLLGSSAADFLELYTDRKGVYDWNRFSNHDLEGYGIASKRWEV